MYRKDILSSITLKGIVMDNLRKVNDAEWRSLSARIGRVVLTVLKDRGMSKQRFAELMGYAQPTVSTLFNEALEDRCWSGPTLVAAARVLKVQVSEIIKAAEDEEGRDAFVAKAFIGGKDGSDERLEGILQWVAPKNLSEDARKMFYRTSVMEATVPALVRAYRSGEIGDARLMELLRKATTASEDASQMWLTLQKQWEQQL